MSSTEGGVIAASPPPPGVTPNLEEPEWIGYRLIIVAVVFAVLSLVFLIPRLWSATFIHKKWRADDYLICVGFAFALANSTICIIQSTMGMGNHIWDLDVDTFKAVMKLGMIGGAMTYNLSTLFIKLSILSFYLRFSVDRAFRMAVCAVMFITVGYTIPNAFLFLYICKPIAFYWDWSIQGGTCINQVAVFDSANILNMSTDFLILLLPIWMLRPLRVPPLKKIGIALVMMTGGFVCGISMMRMITAKIGHNNPDITWQYPVNLIWCLVEEYTGLICACLPLLKSFAKRFFPNLFLFSPSFEQRISSSFPFSSFRVTTTTHADAHAHASGSDSTTAYAAAVGGSGNETATTTVITASGGDDAKEKDVGGRKGWWKLRRGLSGSASRSATRSEDKSKVDSVGKVSVDEVDVERGGDGSTEELSKGGDKTAVGATVVEKRV